MNWVWIAASVPFWVFGLFFFFNVFVHLSRIDWNNTPIKAGSIDERRLIYVVISFVISLVAFPAAAWMAS